MQVKVKNILYPKSHLYACPQPEYFVYEGDEVESPKWAKDSLCLTTNNKDFPIRIIDRSRIVEINSAKMQQFEPRDKVIMVKGSRGETYTVTIDKNGASCTCKGFQFRGSCKHITYDK